MLGMVVVVGWFWPESSTHFRNGEGTYLRRRLATRTIKVIAASAAPP
jgi:hypothetical protein